MVERASAQIPVLVRHHGLVRLVRQICVLPHLADTEELALVPIIALAQLTGLARSV